MTLSTLSNNGQTTIPKEIREFLGLEPRHKISYHLENGKVVIEAVGNSTEELYGSLSAKGKSDRSEDAERAAYAERKYSVGSNE